MDSNPCSNTYPGPEPFSEPESRAVANFILSQAGRWDLSLTLHSKGQLILSPWGYSMQKPEDYAELVRAGACSVWAMWQWSLTIDQGLSPGIHMKQNKNDLTWVMAIGLFYPCMNVDWSPLYLNILHAGEI